MLGYNLGRAIASLCPSYISIYSTEIQVKGWALVEYIWRQAKRISRAIEQPLVRCVQQA